MQEIANKLHIQSVSDWSPVSVQVFNKLGGRGLLANHGGLLKESSIVPRYVTLHRY